jgi:hypothetical protein
LAFGTPLVSGNMKSLSAQQILELGEATLASAAAGKQLVICPDCVATSEKFVEQLPSGESVTIVYNDASSSWRIVLPPCTFCGSDKVPMSLAQILESLEVVSRYNSEE